MVKIAGIGNSMYPGTRHSLGLTFMDYLATLLRPEVPVDQFYTDQRTLSGSIKLLTFHFTDANRFQLPLLEGKETILFKSQEFMNFSGYPIHALLTALKLPPSRLIVVHDDMDIDIGKCKLKTRGSASGHNGIKSVIASLKTNEFARLRLGIGRPSDKANIDHYVLSPFTKRELVYLETITFPLAVQQLFRHVSNS